MLSSDAVIDLGETWDVPESPPPRRPAVPRALFLISALLVSLALPAGSAPAGEPALTQIGVFDRPRSQGGELMLVGELLIAHESGGITVYGLDGTQRWSYRSGAFGSWVYASSLGSILVTTWTSGRLEEHQIETATTVGLDPVTGVVRWRLDRAVRPVGDLLVSDLFPGGGGPIAVYGSEPPGLVWQSEAMVTSTVDSVAGTVLGLDVFGAVSEFELATGTLVRSGRITLPPGGDGLGVWMGGNLLYAQRWDAATTDLLAFDRHTFARVELGQTLLPVQDCGPVLCGIDIWSDESRSGAIDKDTGEVLWTLPEGHWISEAPGGLLAFDPVAGTPRLIDPMTGATLAELPRWRLADGADGLLFLAEREQTFIAVLEASGARVLGALPHRLAQCRYEAPVLMCGLLSGQVGVWRVKP